MNSTNPIIRLTGVCSSTLKTMLFVLSALLLASCGKAAKVEMRDAKGGKKYGGIYRMNEVQELRSFDPVRLNDAPTSHAVHQVYELLVDFDSSLTLQPELADSWEVSPDGLTYTYHLHKGVMFHDSPAFPNGKGREMKASDVKYCFDRILDARAGAFGASYFIGRVKGAKEYNAQTAKGDGKSGSLTGAEGFRVVDEYTFAIDLVEPFAVFKQYPTLGFCYIYPKEAVDHFGTNFGSVMVGTGPFTFDHWTHDQELVLKRNPNYWGHDDAGNQLPLLDGVKITFIKDEVTQVNEFTDGHLEESWRIPKEYFKKIVDENGKLRSEYSRFRLDANPSLSTQYYGMLVTNEAFKDKRVRQAFNYAIDRDKICRFVLQGQAAGPATSGIVPPTIAHYDTSRVHGYRLDLDRARKLMAEAGYPDGKGFPNVTIQLNAGGGRNTDVAQAIQPMLSALGLKVDIKVLEFPQHQELLESGKTPLFRLGWVADYPDPESFLNLLYGKTLPANPSDRSPVNSTRYSNARFDSVFTIALRTQDDAARYALYEEAEQIAVDDAPMLFIYYDIDYRLVQPYVRDYTSNAMDRRDLKRTWFDMSARPA